MAPNTLHQISEAETGPTNSEPSQAYPHNSLTYSKLGNLEELAERVELFECVMEYFPGGIALFDEKLNMVLCNEELKRILDYPESLFENGLPSMRDIFRFNAERGEYGNGDVDQLVDEKMALADLMTAHTYERERPNGTVVEVRGVPLKQGGFLTTYTDVTEQNRRVRQLETLLDNFPGGISLFDKHLKMVLINDQLKEMHEYPEELFTDGLPTLEEVFRCNAERGEYGGGDVDEQVARRMELVRRREPHSYDRKRPNGTVLEVRGVPLPGSGFLTTYCDITEHRQNQDMIEHLALHDALTDLPNRAMFQDRLKQAAAQAERGYHMALHCVDLDKFKRVNDTYGHLVGDELLKQIAERFKKLKRDTDTIARIGGDEFVIIQVGINDQTGAEILAHRVIKSLNSPFKIEGHEIGISASIGIALAPSNGTDPEELFKMADSALYDSKAAGRSRFSVYSGD